MNWKLRDTADPSVHVTTVGREGLYLGLCCLDVIDEASVTFKVFSHDGNLLFGEADVVEQLLVGPLVLRELLLGLVQLPSCHFQSPLQLCGVSTARLTLWGERGGGPGNVVLENLRRKPEAAGGTTHLSGHPASAPVASTWGFLQLGSPKSVFSSSPCPALPLRADVQPPAARSDT